MSLLLCVLCGLRWLILFIHLKTDIRSSVSAVTCEGERSELRTRTAATESVSLCRGDEKLTAFVELESAIRCSGFVGAASKNQGVFSAFGSNFASE